MEACLRLARSLITVLKVWALSAMGSHLSLFFFGMAQDCVLEKRWCFSNMTNMMRMGTKTLEVWREEEL